MLIIALFPISYADTLTKGVIMNWIRNERFISYSSGRAVVLADVEMDSAADLPGADDFDGRTLAKGSIAHDIATGDFYSLNSSGDWINQTGGECND